MPFTVTKNASELRVQLTGSVTIREASALATEIKAHWDEPGPVSIDAGDLQDADTCILQLLCSVQTGASVFNIERHSAEFATAVDRCGMKRALLGGNKEAE